ncbi:MAG: InlB B-repeat-containing protein [Bifidobacterium adolescentis]
MTTASGHGTQSCRPPRDEYKLTGWSTDATGGTAYDFNATQVTGDVTLYARSGRAPHTSGPSSFDLNGGARAGRQGSHEDPVRRPEGLRRRSADLAQRWTIDERAGQLEGYELRRLEHGPQDDALAKSASSRSTRTASR